MLYKEHIVIKKIYLYFYNGKQETTSIVTIGDSLYVTLYIYGVIIIVNPFSSHFNQFIRPNDSIMNVCNYRHSQRYYAEYSGCHNNRNIGLTTNSGTITVSQST